METYYFTNAYSLLIDNLQNGKSTDFINIPGPTRAEEAEVIDTASGENRQRPTTMTRQPQQRSTSNTVSTSGGSY